MSSSPPRFKMGKTSANFRYYSFSNDDELATEPKNIPAYDEPDQDDSNYMSSPISPDLHEKFLRNSFNEQNSIDLEPAQIDIMQSALGVKVMRLDTYDKQPDTAVGGKDDASSALFSPSVPSQPSNKWTYSGICMDFVCNLN